MDAARELGPVVGLDVGGTRSRAVAQHVGRFDVLGEWPTPAPSGFADLLAEVAAGIGLPASSVGIGFAGEVAASGRVIRWPNRPEYIGYDLNAAVRGAFACEAHVLDDCAAAAYGEHLVRQVEGTRQHEGARQVEGDGMREPVPPATTFYLGLGTGIGGGLVIGGQLHQGAHGRACGVGHLPSACDEAAVNACGCGRRDCLQALAGGRALASRARAEGLCTPFVARAAGAGDPHAQRLVQGIVEPVARAVLWVVGLLDPDCIVIGGGLTEAGDCLMQPLSAWLRARGVECAIETSRLGGLSGAVGASMWSVRDLPDRALPTGSFLPSTRSNHVQ